MTRGIRMGQHWATAMVYKAGEEWTDPSDMENAGRASDDMISRRKVRGSESEASDEAECRQEQ